MKKLSVFALLCCLALTVTLFAGCTGAKEIKDWESNPVAENVSPLYRDYYHIFVYGFADSNDDGIGDLKGIESKLDYIAGLNFNGIWLSPIYPSSQSNHNYDVEDYCGIDSRYGTLDDFEDLVTACHQRGISVMLDTVFNHTSNKHPWFVEAQSALRSGDADNKYVSYYKFNNNDPNNYAHFEGASTMPKLNLDNPEVRSELDDIMRFWIDEYNVDGLRLDAAFHFYSNEAKNVEFMQWLMSAAQKYNPDVYMVGEVWKHDTTVFRHYAENSVQSFFNFEWSTASGYNKLIQLLYRPNAIGADLENIVNTNEQGTAAGIDALFASNHDTPRFANCVAYYSSRQEAVTDELMSQHRMAVALLYTQAGNVFNYYGNEIGMRNGIRNSTSQDYIDHTYRTAMNWGSDTATTHEDGMAYMAYGRTTVYGVWDDILGGVAEQQDDQNSLLNFYRRVMLLRRQNPEIAQGTSEFLDSGDESVVVVKRTAGNESILLVYNFDSTQTHTVNLSALLQANGLDGTFAGFLSSDNNRDVTYSNGKVTLPQYSVAVIR